MAGALRSASHSADAEDAEHVAENLRRAPGLGSGSGVWAALYNPDAARQLAAHLGRWWHGGGCGLIKGFNSFKQVLGGHDASEQASVTLLCSGDKELAHCRGSWPGFDRLEKEVLRAHPWHETDDAHCMKQGAGHRGGSYDVHQDRHARADVTVVIKLTDDKADAPPSRMRVVGAAQHFEYGSEAGSSGEFDSMLYHASVLTAALTLKVVFFLRRRAHLPWVPPVPSRGETLGDARWALLAPRAPELRELASLLRSCAPDDDHSLSLVPSSSAGTAACSHGPVEHKSLQAWEELLKDQLPSMCRRGHAHELVHDSTGNHRTLHLLLHRNFAERGRWLVSGATFVLGFDEASGCVVAECLLIASANLADVRGRGFASRLVQAIKAIAQGVAKQRAGDRPCAAILLVQSDMGKCATAFWKRQGLRAGSRANELLSSLSGSIPILVTYTSTSVMEMSIVACARDAPALPAASKRAESSRNMTPYEALRQESVRENENSLAMRNLLQEAASGPRAKRQRTHGAPVPSAQPSRQSLRIAQAEADRADRAEHEAEAEHAAAERRAQAEAAAEAKRAAVAEAKRAAEAKHAAEVAAEAEAAELRAAEVAAEAEEPARAQAQAAGAFEAEGAAAEARPRVRLIHELDNGEERSRLVVAAHWHVCAVELAAEPSTAARLLVRVPFGMTRHFHWSTWMDLGVPVDREAAPRATMEGGCMLTLEFEHTDYGPRPVVEQASAAA